MFDSVMERARRLGGVGDGAEPIFSFVLFFLSVSLPFSSIDLCTHEFTPLDNMTAYVVLVYTITIPSSSSSSSSSRYIATSTAAASRNSSLLKNLKQ
jgi:hypothetical protein